MCPNYAGRHGSKGQLLVTEVQCVPTMQQALITGDSTQATEIQRVPTLQQDRGAGDCVLATADQQDGG